MVNARARSSIGRSISKLKSSISNSFKKSNRFSRIISGSWEEDEKNTRLKASDNLEDPEDRFEASDTNVDRVPGSSESPSSIFKRVHENGDLEDDSNSNDLENQDILKSLEKEEVDRICREYSERNGGEFLDLGLKTYIDALVDTRNFRNRCFQVLSRRPYLNSVYVSNHDYLKKYQSNLNKEVNKKKTNLDLTNYRTTSESAYFTPERTEFEPPMASKLDKLTSAAAVTPSVSKRLKPIALKLTPQKLTRQYYNFTSSDEKPTMARDREGLLHEDHHHHDHQPRRGSLLGYDQSLESKVLDEDLSEFMNKFGYLNSDQNENLNQNTGTNSFSYYQRQGKEQESDEQVLSHNEKLKLLEKIGIQDDYIAKRVCSKISTRLGEPRSRKKRLEDFNLFHKEDLKRKLDFNEQLSQEISHLSSLNTPDKLLSEGAISRGRNSLFERISNTIERNRDTSPTDILSLNVP